MTGPVVHRTALVLRRWRRSDLEAVAALNADPEAMVHFRSTLYRVASDAVVAAADTGTPGAGGWRAFEIGWTVVQ